MLMIMLWIGEQWPWETIAFIEAILRKFSLLLQLSHASESRNDTSLISPSGKVSLNVRQFGWCWIYLYIHVILVTPVWLCRLREMYKQESKNYCVVFKAVKWRLAVGRFSSSRFVRFFSCTNYIYRFWNKNVNFSLSLFTRMKIYIW